MTTVIEHCDDVTSATKAWGCDAANRLVGNDRRRTMRIRERLAFAG